MMRIGRRPFRPGPTAECGGWGFRRYPSLTGALSAALLLVLFLWPAPAAAALDILSLDKVHAGMHGVGRTVFSGDRIEEFGVEVVDVIRGGRPKGNLILFRGTGEVLEHAGIIAGMSGSPVYIDGKLIGAVAFAYPFVKDPIGGITPIEEMLELDRYPLPTAQDIEAMESGPVVHTGDPRSSGTGFSDPGKRSSPIGELGDDPTSRAREDGDARAFGSLWSTFTRDQGAGGPERDARIVLATVPEGAASITTAGGANDAPDGLRPLPVPLAFSGWDPVLLEAVRGSAGAVGFLAGDASEVTMAEGAGRAPGADAADRPGESALFEPGSAVALELVGGDATIAAIGTVTAVDDGRVYAFGHPMVQGGAVAFPMFRARIHSVMPSQQVSFKMGSPTTAVGGVWQDRRSGILGLLGAVPPTIPVRVSISLPGRVDEVYRYRIVRDPILSPLFLPWTVSNSYQHTGWAQGETTARSEVEVHFDGGRVVRRRDLVVTDAPALAVGGGAVLPASLLLTNPFQRVRLDSLSVRVTAEPGHASAEVTRLRCTPRRITPGDTLRVEITLQPWRGPETTRLARIAIPSGWEGKRLRITAAGAGEFLDWDRDRAPGKWSPRDLDDLMRMVETLPSAGSLLLRVSSRDLGALVRGRELPGLPTSLLLAGSEAGEAASIRPAAGATLDERTFETPWEISGRETAEVEITR